MIDIRNIRVAYDKKIIIEDLTLSVKPNAITAILGPNGCGKSTLLGAISGNHKVLKGQIAIKNKALAKYKAKALAKIMAVLPQDLPIPTEYSVRELISHGRYPYVPFGRRLSAQDQAVIDRAVEKTGMAGLQCRKLGALSGGERQRAFIGMTLAQEPEILLLDEPTTHLDIAHQIEILNLIRSICDKQSVTVLMVLHDINLAMRYADNVILMKDGKLIDEGSTDEVLNEKHIEEVYGINGIIQQFNDQKNFITM